MLGQQLLVGALDPTTAYSKATITKNWPQEYPQVVPDKIPPTSEWTSNELLLLKIHIFPIRTPDTGSNVKPHWHEYLCPPVDLLGNAAIFSATELSIVDLVNNNNFPDTNLDEIVQEFYGLMHISAFADTTESAIDDIVKFLLRKLNPDRTALAVIGTRPEFVVMVGGAAFTSIPDVSVVMPPSATTTSMCGSIIVVEDKKSTAAAENAEYRLAGELVATAYNNLFAKGITCDQTLFAIRVSGRNFYFYRVDIPRSYIISLAKGVPNEHLTIFKLGSGSASGSGISLDLPINPGFDNRMTVMHVLSSMLHAAHHVCHAWLKKETPEMTTKRLADLLPSRFY